MCGEAACLIQLCVEGLPGLRLLATQLIHVIPLDHFVTGIVFGTEENGVLWNRKTALLKQLAYYRAISHGSVDACVWAAMTATAGAAVVGCHVRVILARRAMPHHDNEGGITGNQADGAQEVLDTIGLFLVGKTVPRILDSRCFITLCIDRHQGID